MKILHTGDWHIGKLVHGVSMLEEQKYVLDQLENLIDKEKPEVLIIAGDIYDRSVPTVQAVELLDEVLSKIIMKYKTNIIIISGNHDSPDRLGFASKILHDNGLYISGNLEKKIEPIIINDEYGIVNFYPIPFLEPAIVRGLFDDDTVKSHDLAMKKVLDSINEKIDYSKRNVCIAHAFVMGSEKLELSESERPLSIGGTSNVNVEYFEKFNYVALGHLHRPQKVKYEHVRYSGSLLKYSFSETLQKKSVTLIELDKNGEIEIQQIPLNTIRDMRDIKGDLDKLTQKEIYSLANTNDYIRATLTDKVELVDPIGKLRAIYPNILKLEREQFTREAGISKTSASSDFDKKNPIDLFNEFYSNISGKTFTKEKEKVIVSILGDIEKKRRNK